MGTSTGVELGGADVVVVVDVTEVVAFSISSVTGTVLLAVLFVTELAVVAGGSIMQT